MLTFLIEMKRIGIILVFCTLWTTDVIAASRVSSASASTRQGSTSQHVRTSNVAPRKTVRVATTKNVTKSRKATTQTTPSRNINSRSGNTARAAVTQRTATNNTRTGTEYENCKNAYFTCMDQFCQLKNDDYRRCSCSDRITSLQAAKDSLQQAGEQLNAFNENLDIVGKTAAQATAMNTASEGENALTKDKSASAALLTAIMNSIRGSDSRVENNKLSDLNSIDLSFDAANSFGTSDIGQIVASYNGQALYSAVYPQCRNAVNANCNDASLQRAVNAYLMAIEQDCNTVQTAITKKQKETHAAIRESSAMLDLARAENHKKHNSDDIATCMSNVESAILSEEVCGANYHKCLDNGEYIDVATGAPIAGVVDFYKLGTLLSFNSERSNADQNLAQNPNNRNFVNAFEKRVKQFAEPALDKCYDDSATVWKDYLNKALLDIYYAQQSKVNEIKQGCFDFVSSCYMNGSTAMTAAMQGLVAAQTTTLNPNVLSLNKSLCSDYIASCNNMFDGQIIADYIENRHDTDSLTACRAVVKQCFDNYGGANYENFYYPSSNIFATGEAPNWFSLYSYTCNANGNCTRDEGYKSECARQLASIDACSNMVEEAFGGLDLFTNGINGTTIDIFNKYATSDTNASSINVSQLNERNLRPTGVATEIYNQIIDILQTGCSNLDGKFVTVQNLKNYNNSYDKNNFCKATFHNIGSIYENLYTIYSIGKTYSSWDLDFYANAAVSISPRWGDDTMWWRPTSKPNNILENMCPRNYWNTVDTQSWGACLCWENGGRRSNDGTSTRCTASFPVKPIKNYIITALSQTEYKAQQTITHGLNLSCTPNTPFITGINQDPNATVTTSGSNTPTQVPLNAPAKYENFSLWPYNTGAEADIPTEQDWCTANVNKNNQVCPFGVKALESTPSANDVTNGGLQAGDCANCPFDWTKQTNNQTTKCCPADYTLVYYNGRTSSNTYGGSGGSGGFGSGIGSGTGAGSVSGMLDGLGDDQSYESVNFGGSGSTVTAHAGFYCCPSDKPHVVFSNLVSRSASTYYFCQSTDPSTNNYRLDNDAVSAVTPISVSSDIINDSEDNKFPKANY